MSSETPKAGSNRPPIATYEPFETVALDEALRRLAVGLAAIDAATGRFHRKLKGLEPWSVFELPPSLQGHA